LYEVVTKDLKAELAEKDVKAQAILVSRMEDTMEEIKSKIQAQEDELSDRMIITKILMSLPAEYRHFVSAWESVPENKQTINELSARLYIEETRLKQDEPATEEALTAKQFN
ncbi:hypothetical protein CBL_20176, partial [Carabus blaptoides fortunei]